MSLVVTISSDPCRNTTVVTVPRGMTMLTPSGRWRQIRGHMYDASPSHTHSCHNHFDFWLFVLLSVHCSLFFIVCQIMYIQCHERFDGRRKGKNASHPYRIIYALVVLLHEACCGKCHGCKHTGAVRNSLAANGPSVRAHAALLLY